MTYSSFHSWTLPNLIQICTLVVPKSVPISNILVIYTWKRKPKEGTETGSRSWGEKVRELEREKYEESRKQECRMSVKGLSRKKFRKKLKSTYKVAIFHIQHSHSEENNKNSQPKAETSAPKEPCLGCARGNTHLGVATLYFLRVFQVFLGTPKAPFFLKLPPSLSPSLSLSLRVSLSWFGAISSRATTQTDSPTPSTPFHSSLLPSSPDPRTLFPLSHSLSKDSWAGQKLYSLLLFFSTHYVIVFQCHVVEEAENKKGKKKWSVVERSMPRSSIESVWLKRWTRRHPCFTQYPLLSLLAYGPCWPLSPIFLFWFRKATTLSFNSLSTFKRIFESLYSFFSIPLQVSSCSTAPLWLDQKFIELLLLFFFDSLYFRPYIKWEKL